MKETERTVIAKPIASRPIFSSFRSFSELLADPIDPSPSPSPSAETAIAAMRPKTVRFNPPPSPAAAAAVVVSQIGRNSIKSTVVYKPQAKVVSSSTVSLLANMGNFNDVLQQKIMISPSEIREHSKHSSGDPHHQTGEQANVAPQNVEDDDYSSKALLESPAASDRPFYDGYNWRTYGQKHVKGSEYPRSYYKCMYPNCPVKRKVERSPEGQIAEIVYRGKHSHPKPQPPKRSSSGKGQDVNIDEGNAGFQGYEPVVGTGSAECEDGSKGREIEDDEPRSKRSRRSESNPSPAEAVFFSGEGVQEAPRILVQNSTETVMVGDGFRWRKYGQKVVKGNPYPRSYYRCTSLKCNVRKHVERVSVESNSFITTYEGRHNHERPLIKSTSAGGSESELPQAASGKE